MSTHDPVDDDRWRALSPYLDQALEMSAGERQCWLTSLRAQDPALAADLQTLLAEDDLLEQDRFLTGAAPDVPRPSHTASHAAPVAGESMGDYTLTSCIGEGGMGTVWLARRSDGRFEGRAAVKLLNASLMGRAGAERFAREGTILARLTHPSIAHLIDAGVSASGQPYLVLEYVQGQHIDRYCDDRHLDVEARLRLFLDVLTAVAHAHANLVVHRDIKPSNVLVPIDEPDRAHAAHRVKLLDFGIAKLLKPEADAIALTRDSGFALTPAYAAPEQLTGRPVTTATDVYSLGVLLYVLLGGQHPVAHGRHSPAAVIAAVVDAEAPRLSATVAPTTSDSAEALAINAARRRTTPDKLRRLLQGDVDTIVAKALKRDPQERYPSVTAFADDLRRYLADQPIAARPDTVAYRTVKFVRRHRVPVGLAALAVIAVVVGLAGTVTQARRATRQAARADQEARTASAQRDFALRQVSRAEAINDLNAFLLSDTAPSAKPFTASDLLERAEGIVERQPQTDENHVEMLISIARQYLALDHHHKARRLLNKAYTLSRTLPDRGTFARAACALAPTISREGEPVLARDAKAEGFFRAGDRARAEALWREGFDALPNEPQYALHRTFCLLRGAEVASLGSDQDAAFERIRAAQALLKASRLSSPLLEYGVSMLLAKAYAAVGRFRDVGDTYADASRTLASLGRDNTATAGTLFNSWGGVLALVGRPLEAEPLLRRGIQIQSRSDGREQPFFGAQLIHFARVLNELRRFPEATDAATRAYQWARRKHGAGNQQLVALAQLTRASIARQVGDLPGAARLLADVQPRLTWMPPGNPTFATLASEQALLAQARGETTAALASADRAIAIAEASTHVPLAPRFLVRRSQLLLQLHRVEQARADAARALATTQAAAGQGAWSSETGRAYLALGRALQAQGKPGEAHAALSSALEHLAPTLGSDHPETRLARQLAAAAADARTE